MSDGLWLPDIFEELEGTDCAPCRWRRPQRVTPAVVVIVVFSPMGNGYARLCARCARSVRKPGDVEATLIGGRWLLDPHTVAALRQCDPARTQAMLDRGDVGVLDDALHALLAIPRRWPRHRMTVR